ncbi:hypothetical protein [Desulfotruncus arcticus]|uniref:hypothetical protein n=1 Tax=Desulfotruncus arcticus TaxID=341036 RepID=UPI000B845D80|nr:hypothetical protein [Desulfotruncus arcticus]
MEKLLERYTPDQQKTIADYWDTIRFTRRSNRVSVGIKQKELEYWAKFDPEVVIKALKIHIEKYPHIRENYTRGILRNLRGGSVHGGDHDSRKTAEAAKPSGKRDSRAEEAFKRRLSGI